jgi:hypothetical protein
MRLIWNNATTFNAPGTQVHCDARTLSVEFERLQRQHFTKAASVAKPVTPTAATPSSNAPTPLFVPPTSSDRAPSGIKIGPLVNSGASKFLFGHCSAALEALKHRDNKQWFQVPVDPAKHGCPTYFDVIKHPMDLGAITEKLNTGKCVSPYPASALPSLTQSHIPYPITHGTGTCSWMSSQPTFVSSSTTRRNSILQSTWSIKLPRT